MIYISFKLLSFENIFPTFLSSLKVSKEAKMPTVNKYVVMHGYCPLLANEKQFLAKLWPKLTSFVHCIDFLFKI